ncbi:MAG: porphobilinogen synthase [Chloroflexota bacterium]
MEIESPESGGKTVTSSFPSLRMRRLRRTETMRRMVRETAISPSDFIYPFFVTGGHGVRQDVSSMPGVAQVSVDELTKDAREIRPLGIPAVLLFGLPESKDELGSQAYARDGIVQVAIRELKDQCPELIVVADLCLCEYTSHGHCGVVQNGGVENDATLELLNRTALAQAEAGADIIAPSDMMDGRIGSIRNALDAQGFSEAAIMAYSAKFASGFYGPFREAADSTPQFGDRWSYQMDPANGREALREIELDINEGADFMMVKPALAYLDLIRAARERFDLPLVAYNVSGEYSMVKAAAANGWLDEERVTMEILTGIKRAGADLIISYHAPDVCRWLGA